MATKRLKRPRDPVSLAKLVGDIATGQVREAEVEPDLARQRAGIIGGKARAVVLSPKQRQEIARRAAKSRWKSSNRKKEEASVGPGKK